MQNLPKQLDSNAEDNSHYSLELKPPSPDATLTRQLADFAAVLGYETGDRLYVRALLPKNLSDETAVDLNLKFKIEENGKKRLIPSTRRGYLTVGSWEFTHIRKDKEPAVHKDGLAKLSELNKEGRGIYFIVNPGGEKDSDISSARSLFWENDDKSKPEQIEQALTSKLPIGAIIETRKSLHCYSPLSQPLEDLSKWKQLQERLIQKMDSDPAIRNSSRLMRLPGFDHVSVEGEAQNERLVFTPVRLRHIDKAAQGSLEALTIQLPQWDKERWERENKTAQRHNARQGESAAPTLAADNPWDIRNFAQYLNGDQYSQNGWLQVQCPSHGGEGSSGTSLGINQSTGHYTCHGGCDTKDVYRAARKLAEERGWQPPKANPKKTIDAAPTDDRHYAPKKAHTVEAPKLAPVSSQSQEASKGGRTHPKPHRRSHSTAGRISPARPVQVEHLQKNLNIALAYLGRELVNSPLGENQGNQRNVNGEVQYRISVNLANNTMSVYAKDRGDNPILVDANGQIDHVNSQATIEDVERFQQMAKAISTQPAKIKQSELVEIG